MSNSPIIYSGSTAKSLLSTLDLNGGARILSGTIDPTGVTTATAGSIYLNSSNGYWYQNNDGSTSWTVVIGKAPAFSGTMTYVAKMSNTSGTYNVQFDTTMYNQLGTNSQVTVSTQNLTTTNGSTTATAANGALLDFGQIVASSNVSALTTIANISGNTITLNQNASGTGTVSTVFSQYKWIVPVAGIYRCNALVWSQGVFSTPASGNSTVLLVKNGTVVSQMSKMYPAAVAVGRNIPGGGSVEMQFAANDAVWWQWFTGLPTISISDPSAVCSFSWVSGI